MFVVKRRLFNVLAMVSLGLAAALTLVACHGTEMGTASEMKRSLAAQMILRQFVPQHLPVQEHDRAQCLVLAGRAEPLVPRQMGQIRLDLQTGQFSRLAPAPAIAAESQEVQNPCLVTLDSRRREMPPRRHVSHAFQELHSDPFLCPNIEFVCAVAS
jgi:hypothetical protein